MCEPDDDLLPGPLLQFESTNASLVRAAGAAFPSDALACIRLAYLTPEPPFAAPILIRAVDGRVSLQFRGPRTFRSPIEVTGGDSIQLVRHVLAHRETLGCWALREWSRALPGDRARLIVARDASTVELLPAEATGVLALAKLGPEDALHELHARVAAACIHVGKEIPVHFRVTTCDDLQAELSLLFTINRSSPIDRS